ncbi:MAG: FxsA family protein [Planctomycetaceae bacterium]|nr:FxsA family protein [Planctomycetaceae bacterium]
MKRLILLFTVVPLVELALLIWIGSHTSVSGTIAIVLVTGFVGAALAKHQGWQTWRRLQDGMRSGEPPADVLLDGVMILIAGALMVTPGVLTDAVGFALLLPSVRGLLKARLRSRLMAHATAQFRSFHSGGTGQGGGAEGAGTPTGTVIDAEFTRKDDESSSPPTDG